MAVTDEISSPLLPKFISAKDYKTFPVDDLVDRDNASHSGLVFNVTTSIIGGGIMSIPATLQVLGVAPALMLIVTVAVLSEISVDFLLRFTVKKTTYAGLMGVIWVSWIVSAANLYIGYKPWMSHHLSHRYWGCTVWNWWEIGTGKRCAYGNSTRMVRNPNDLPLHKPSSILFTNDGKLVLRTMPDNKEKPLIPDIEPAVAYAVMHDDGNFVLYGSDSQIVWESFDHPTDTILGGQKLNAGVGLRSVSYKLSVQQGNGLVAIHYLVIMCSRMQGCETGYVEKVVSWEVKGKTYSPITLNLDTSGNLYLVGADDSVLKYLYGNKTQQQNQGSIAKEEGVHMYRATLDSEGIFYLYKERIDGSASDSEKSSSIVWSSSPKSSEDNVAKDKINLVLFYLCIICVFIGVMAFTKCENQARQPRRGDVESGRTYCC